MESIDQSIHPLINQADDITSRERLVNDLTASTGDTYRPSFTAFDTCEKFRGWDMGVLGGVGRGAKDVFGSGGFTFFFVESCWQRS